MGLYGIVVVTTAPVGATAGTAYPAVGASPAVSYYAEIPMLFSEIDPVQNNAVQCCRQHGRVQRDDGLVTGSRMAAAIPPRLPITSAIPRP